MLVDYAQFRIGSVANDIAICGPVPVRGHPTVDFGTKKSRDFFGNSSNKVETFQNSMKISGIFGPKLTISYWEPGPRVVGVIVIVVFF